MAFKKLLILSLLLSFDLFAQGRKPDLYRDFSNKACRVTHEIGATGTVIKVGSQNRIYLYEGYNYVIIYDNNGEQDLIYTPELATLTKTRTGEPTSHGVAATQISLIENIVKITGKREDQIKAYAAIEIIVTNGKVTEVNNRSTALGGGRDLDHLNFAVDVIKQQGVKLESNTKIVSYNKEDYKKDGSFYRGTARNRIYNYGETAEELYNELLGIYKKLAEKYPDPKTAGFVNLKAIEGQNLDFLSDFISLAQAPEGSIVSTVNSYLPKRGSVDEPMLQLTQILAEGKNAVSTNFYVKEMNRKEVVTSAFDEAVKKYGETPLAVLDIFKNEEVLPYNGTVLSLGAGADFYEWIVPLLGRSDTKVVVVESPDATVFAPSSKRQGIDYKSLISYPDKVLSTLVIQIWDELRKYNGDILDRGLIKNEQELYDAIKTRVTFLSSLDFSSRLVEANIVVSRLPWRYDPYGTIKKDGFVWLVTERTLDINVKQKTLFDDPTHFSTNGYDVVELEDNKVNTLLASTSDAASRPGRFRSFSLNGIEKPYLLFPKSSNVSPATKGVSAVINTSDNNNRDDIKEDSKPAYSTERYLSSNTTDGEYKVSGNTFVADGSKKITLPALPYGGKVVYLIYRDADDNVKLVYKEEIPNLKVDLKNKKAEFVVTPQSLFNKLHKNKENIKELVSTGYLIIMPNGEIAAVKGYSGINYAVDFFKRNGVDIPDKAKLVTYDDKDAVDMRSDAISNAKEFIHILQSPNDRALFDPVLNQYKELAKKYPSSENPGAVLDQEILESGVLSESLKKMLVNIERKLLNGETFSNALYKAFLFSEHLYSRAYLDLSRLNTNADPKPIIIDLEIDNSEVEQKEFYTTGELKSKKFFKEGVLASIETYYQSGRIKSKDVYKSQGIRNGVHYEYFDKDAPGGIRTPLMKESGFYHNNKRVGAFYSFYESNGSKKEIVLYDRDSGKIITDTKYREDGNRILEIYDYQDGVIVKYSSYYPTGQLRSVIKPNENGDKMEVTTYVDGTRGKEVKNVEILDNNKIVDVIDTYNSNVEAVPSEVWNYGEEKEAELSSILVKLTPATEKDVRFVEAYMQELLKNGNTSKLNTIEYMIGWLYSAYSSIDQQDRSLFVDLSRKTVELKASKGDYLPLSQVDYKKVYDGISNYLMLTPYNSTKPEELKVKIDFYIRLAIEKFVEDINKKFEAGVPVEKLLTETECKTFTLVQAYLVDELNKQVASFAEKRTDGVTSEKDMKEEENIITARMFAAKDMSEIIKSSSALSYSKDYTWISAESDYVLKKVVEKADLERLIDSRYIEQYKKDDVKVDSRLYRLKTSAKRL